MQTVLIDPAISPPHWQCPWDPPIPTPPPLLASIDAIIDSGGQDPVQMKGGEPLEHPDIHKALARLTAHGIATTLWSSLPELNDDLNVRLLAPHDVRFRVPVPATHPDAWAQLTNGQTNLEDLEFSLRNLQAFAYPFDLFVPIARENVHVFADTAAHLQRQWTLAVVHAEVVQGTTPDDPRWAHTPRWEEVDAQLLLLQQRDLRRPPRLYFSGIPALALSLEAFEKLDLRVNDNANDSLTVSDDYLRHHPAPAPIPEDALAKRRVWLVTPPKERPSYRGHPMDRFRDAVSVVLVRQDHVVFAVLEQRREGIPYLVSTTHYGIAVAGRFKDTTLADRFRTLCMRIRTDALDTPPADLERLRELAHVLRRSMKPKYDDEAPTLREEVIEP